MSGFSQRIKKKYPPRFWLIEGEATSGKSTFSTQMRSPILPIDADHRWDEVTELVQGEVYELSTDPRDHISPRKITDILSANMPHSQVGTIVVDSLTAIITPYIVETMLDNREGKNKNQVASFVDKALYMRILQDGLTRWGCDVLYISHVQITHNAKAEKVEKLTLTDTEYKRLQRTINLHLRVVQQGPKRGIKVIWSHKGKSGMTLWDDTGTWAGMPEKIEETVYGGSEYSFTSPQDAWAWAIKQGVFETSEEAEVAYKTLKLQVKPTTPAQMWFAWGDMVARKVKELETFSEMGGEQVPAEI